MTHPIYAIVAAWVFCGAGTFSANALAGPDLSLTFPSDHEDLFKAGHNDVSITLNQGSGSPNKNNLRVRAGLFHGGEGSGTSGFDASNLFRDENDVLAYCVDLLNSLADSEIYGVENIRIGQVDNRDGVRRDFGRMITFLGAVNTVLADAIYDLGFGSKNWLNPDTGWMSGAIQVGIWESLYEEQGTNLSLGPDDDGNEGWFSATGVKSDGEGFLSTAFGLVNNLTTGSVGDITVPVNPGELKLARIDDNQDLLLDPKQVPLPGTLLLLLGGLSGLLLWRERAS